MHDLAWTIGTRIPCTRSVSHTGYLAHGNSKSETRGRIRHQNNGKRSSIKYEMKERGHENKESRKQELTITKDLAIELFEGSDS